jgi:hypothetical protein
MRGGLHIHQVNNWVVQSSDVPSPTPAIRKASWDNWPVDIERNLMGSCLTGPQSSTSETTSSVPNCRLSSNIT